MLADIVPITLLMHLYLAAFLYRLAELGVAGVLVGLLGFQALSLLTGSVLPNDLWNGSVAYLPALIILGLQTLWAWRFRPGPRRELLFSLGLFGVSLIARSIDPRVCAYWPPGTHFAWHLLKPSCCAVSSSS